MQLQTSGKNKWPTQEKHDLTIKRTKYGQQFKQFLESNKIDSVGSVEKYSLRSVGDCNSEF